MLLQDSRSDSFSSFTMSKKSESVYVSLDAFLGGNSDPAMSVVWVACGSCLQLLEVLEALVKNTLRRHFLIFREKGHRERAIVEQDLRKT